MYETPPIPSLYVFESVELELSLTTVSIESDEPVLDDFSCPIRLLSGLYLVFSWFLSHEKLCFCLSMIRYFPFGFKKLESYIVLNFHSFYMFLP